MATEALIKAVDQQEVLDRLSDQILSFGRSIVRGQVEGDVVQSPWHGSRFNVKDGRVVDGPATFPQPCFEARVREGQIEVRSVDRKRLCGSHHDGPPQRREEFSQVIHSWLTGPS